MTSINSHQRAIIFLIISYHLATKVKTKYITRAVKGIDSPMVPLHLSIPGCHFHFLAGK